MQWEKERHLWLLSCCTAHVLPGELAAGKGDHLPPLASTAH